MTPLQKLSHPLPVLSGFSVHWVSPEKLTMSVVTSAFAVYVVVTVPSRVQWLIENPGTILPTFTSGSPSGGGFRAMEKY
ncbi:hypothetical protein ACIGJO_29430 [Streptomyces sp. NPDC079020]|uniref:hypothetical protein n=1 Tax=Streptomyces sp. NPDC079020 TaxID=3365722 RepID=UPI0037CF7D51